MLCADRNSNPSQSRIPHELQVAHHAPRRYQSGIDAGRIMRLRSSRHRQGRRTDGKACVKKRQEHNIFRGVHLVSRSTVALHCT